MTAIIPIFKISDFKNMQPQIEELYEFIADEMVRLSSFYLDRTTRSIKNKSKRPHWRTRAIKNMIVSEAIMELPSLR